MTSSKSVVSTSSYPTGTHEKGLCPDEVSDRYTKWGKNYEWDLRKENYQGPVYAAETVAELFPESTERSRSDIKILDVAAGSGFVGIELRERGFSEIDALEPSEGMVQLAKEKYVYKNIFQEFLSSEPTTIQSDSYDAVVTSGGMGESHIPCAALDEIIRLAKPGGYVIIVMREAYLYHVEEYKDRLEPRMKDIEAKGQWEVVSRRIVPRYSFTNDGVVFVFKITKSQ